MKICLQDGLPYVTISLVYKSQQLKIENVLIDTGSCGTIFSIDKVLEIGLEYETDDIVYRIRGIGGSEFVFIKKVDSLSLGELSVDDFEIEIGAMEYGFDLDGIIGMDFIEKVKAIIDFSRLEIY
jgi:predicted aspartyl protease